jgi:hypothetical protein
MLTRSASRLAAPSSKKDLTTGSAGSRAGPGRVLEVEADIGASPKTVGKLRKMTAWPENLAITTPQEGDPKSAVKVSKANVATRVSPKT